MSPKSSIDVSASSSSSKWARHNQHIWMKQRREDEECSLNSPPPTSCAVAESRTRGSRFYCFSATAMSMPPFPTVVMLVVVYDFPSGAITICPTITCFPFFERSRRYYGRRSWCRCLSRREGCLWTDGAVRRRYAAVQSQGAFPRSPHSCPCS